MRPIELKKWSREMGPIELKKKKKEYCLFLMANQKDDLIRLGELLMEGWVPSSRPAPAMTGQVDLQIVFWLQRVVKDT